MVKNYITIAVRNILRFPIFSGINILGLSIGLAGFLLIINYVIFENSYDKFHSNSKNIYRLRVEGKQNSGQVQFQSARNFSAAGPEVTKVFDEITNYTRIRNFSTILAKQSDNGEFLTSFVEDKIIIADTAFFSIFDFTLLQGDQANILKNSNEILLSRSTAIKYFGQDWESENILNQTLVTMDSIQLAIGGVFEDVPLHSHLKFDIIVSYEILFKLYGDFYHTNWSQNSLFTYLEILPGTDIDALEAKFPSVIDKYKGDYFERTQYREDFYLQQLENIHLHSHFEGEAEVNGDAGSVFILFLIGLFVISIAIVNYVNLATARSLYRAKEVGIRKASGATRRHLILQFLYESIMITLVSFVLAYTLIQVFYPFFVDLVGKNIPLILFNSVLWFSMILLFVLGIAILAGIYPAFIISAFKPSDILKGKFSKSGKGSLVRKVLVSVQLTISIGLIAGSLAIYDQLSFMISSDPGVNLENTIIINAPEYYEIQSRNDQYIAFKESLKNHSDILSVSNSRFVPGEQVWGWGGYIRQAGAPDTDAKAYDLYFIDDAFLTDYDIELLAGRFFSINRAMDSTVVILSETASEKLGFESAADAIGKFIYYPMNNAQNNRKIEVIGVTKDFHQVSLKEDFLPVIFQLQRVPDRFISIKFEGSKLQNLLPIMRDNFRETFGEIPFDYSLLEDRFNEHYSPDKLFGKIVSVFTFLAIFISCLGLFGLSTFLVLQKRKEIGIRKVLGATTGKIVGMLSSELVITILISSLAALPIAYFLIDLWLQNYPNRIQFNLVMYLIPPIIVLLVALITVGTQTFSAANSNPKDILMDD